MKPKKTLLPKGSEPALPSKGGRPRKRKLTTREQLLALTRKTPLHLKSGLTQPDCIGLVRAIVNATGHKRAVLLREFAEQKKISERHARRLLPMMRLALREAEQRDEAFARFTDNALAPYRAIESSIGRLDEMARTTRRSSALLIARVTAEHRKIANKHRDLIFHHPRVWEAATQVTTDAAGLDIIVNAWRDAPDDDARELVMKELEEIARAK